MKCQYPNKAKQKVCPCRPSRQFILLLCSLWTADLVQQPLEPEELGFDSGAVLHHVPQRHLIQHHRVLGQRPRRLQTAACSVALQGTHCSLQVIGTP